MPGVSWLRRWREAPGTLGIGHGSFDSYLTASTKSGEPGAAPGRTSRSTAPDPSSRLSKREAMGRSWPKALRRASGSLGITRKPKGLRMVLAGNSTPAPKIFQPERS